MVEKGVVPQAEVELMVEVLRAVDDWRGAEQQHLSADQPWREGAIPTNTRVSEVMTFVHDHESGISRRRHASGKACVRPGSDRNAKAPGGISPLSLDRWRNDADGRFSADRLREGEREIGLSAADRVGTEHRALTPDGMQENSECIGLRRIEPGRGIV
jgi:hypothetical protein